MLWNSTMSMSRDAFDRFYYHSVHYESFNEIEYLNVLQSNTSQIPLAIIKKMLGEYMWAEWRILVYLSLFCVVVLCFFILT